MGLMDAEKLPDVTFAFCGSGSSALSIEYQAAFLVRFEKPERSRESDMDWSGLRLIMNTDSPLSCFTG